MVQRFYVIGAVVCLTAVAAAGQQRSEAELVERTLAIVGGSAITLSDVQTAMALGLVGGVTELEAATEALVERALILREVERYAPPEPEASRI